MTITNRELFVHDPTQSKIPNDGVVNVGRPETQQQREVLEWELKSFVCEGEYARGLERIFDSFLNNLSQPKQPAVWVSGFYGSGKSHLVRVLEYLWRDLPVLDGKSARSLVTLPQGISDSLVNLSTEGKRAGGLWSAAGTLASGKSKAVRLAFLSVLFESAGLPEQYPLARFVIWATENSYLDAIRRDVEAAGKSLEKEVHDLYVSPLIAKALLKADPSLGNSVKDVRDLLRDQFPPTTEDITDDDVFDAMDDVLAMRSGTPGKTPLTLVVLDEMQQYLGEDGEKALTVQNLVELCSARYESQVLFVATGQYALTATPTLQKLTDRFTVTVALSDTDVESVVRQVVLLKRPEHISVLKSKLEDVSGEIDRQLGGTQIATRAADKKDLVADYPLLPTRRRFWELALRAIDLGGKTGVLRTQLKIVHEAACEVADLPIGHVVGGDFIYEQQAPGMLQSGVLLKEIDELARGLRLQGPDGILKSRLCALVFLITQIPTRTLGGETGLRASSAFLSDLLVEDISHDGANLRKRVPELLDELVAEGRLMRLDDEYRLQTEEGAEWEQDYRRRLAILSDDPGRLPQLRNERLAEAVNLLLSGLKFTQGLAKEPRKIRQYWGQDEPFSATDEDVPVWVQDEWSVTEASVKKSVGEAGDESPIVFVLLPKRDAELTKLLASYAAAQDTVQQKPTPQTDEGKAAQRAMKTRVVTDEERIKALFQDVVAHARIFQGGGTEMTTSSVRDSVETAVHRSLVRLFPKFQMADNANWGKVVTKARDGAPDSLEAVGHHGDASSNAVCKEVLAAIGAAGTKGADLHRQFTAPPFGWPKDAINGTLLALMAAGNIRAAIDGKNLGGPKELLPTQVGKASFYKEDPPPNVDQRLKIRDLLAGAKIQYESNREGSQIPALLQRLKDLAARSGGTPPLPEPPATDYLDDLLALGGNQQFTATADDHERLRKNLTTWLDSDKKRSQRETEWEQLERLLRHSDGLPVAETVRAAHKAIRDGRQLLDDPNPIKPVLDAVTEDLRKEMTSRIRQLSNAQEAAVNELETLADWGQLDANQRILIVEESNLGGFETPDISTASKLLESLDAIPLRGWQDRISLVPSRREQARQRAAKLLEPESVTVTPPSATLKTGADLESYLGQLRDQVQPHLEANKTVII